MTQAEPKQQEKSRTIQQVLNREVTLTVMMNEVDGYRSVFIDAVIGSWTVGRWNIHQFQGVPGLSSPNRAVMDAQHNKMISLEAWAYMVRALGMFRETFVMMLQWLG